MYLGIDCGTQGTKALLVDGHFSVVGRGYARHQLLAQPNGAREQEPRWWIEAMIASVRQALAASPNPAPVQALAVSGQQHGLVVLDEHAEVIRPAKLWNDTETAAHNTAILERFGGAAAFHERFGIMPLTGYTLSKLVWMAEREPENFARIRHILLPHEYLNYWLTGEFRAEAGDASGTAFFDVRTREWLTAVLDEVDGGTGMLARALPQLIGPTDIVGTLRPEAAQQLGVDPACLVAAGGGDNMMGAIGTGNVREGIVTLSLGTSGTVYAFSQQPSRDASGSVAPFCSSSGGWLPLVCTMNVTNVVTATVDLLGKTVADIEPAIVGTAPGADGLVFLPYLNGERTPDLPAASGSLHGLTPLNYTPAHLIRAAVEGVTFGLLDGLDLVAAGRAVDTIQVIGGGARSRAWRQLIADATGAVIHVPVEEEAGCLGAAAQAIVASSQRYVSPVSFGDVTAKLVRVNEAATCTPQPEHRAAYDAARVAYRHHRHQQHGL